MDVANEILDAIEIIVDKQTKEQTTQIYPGICKSVSGNSCVMSINGRDNTVQFYGSTPTVGTIYRVFVPNGNMSMAFIITTNGGGSSASGVSSVNGLTGDVNLTASNVGAAPVGYGPTYNDLSYNTDGITNSGFFICKNGVPTNDWGCVVNVRYSEDRATQWFKPAYNWSNVVNITKDTLFKREKFEGVWYPWEYVNPPMGLGIEYRTTERYCGKPVYVKLVDLGSCPSSGFKDVTVLGDTEVGFRCEGEWTFGGGSTLPFETTSSDRMAIAIIGKNVRIFTGGKDFSNYTAKATIYYTKTTN